MKKVELTYAEWLASVKAQAPPPGSFTISDVARDLGITHARAEGHIEREIRAGRVRDLGLMVDGRNGNRKYFVIVQPNGKKVKPVKTTRVNKDET